MTTIEPRSADIKYATDDLIIIKIVIYDLVSLFSYHNFNNIWKLKKSLNAAWVFVCKLTVESVTLKLYNLKKNAYSNTF